MTNCIYCKVDVEKRDICEHRHGAHKFCCEKNSKEFLEHIVKQSGIGYNGRFLKENVHASYGQ